MPDYNLARLACRVLALYTIVVQTGNTISVLLLPNTPNTLHLAIPYIIMVILGLILWKMADSLAHAMISNNEFTQFKNINNDHIQIVLFSVLGLYFIGMSLPKIASSIINIFVFIKSNIHIPINATLSKTIVEPIFQLIIGLVLLLGSRGLVAIINKFHQIDMKE